MRHRDGSLLQFVERRIQLFERQMVTQVELNNVLFFDFVEFLSDDDYPPHEFEPSFDQLPEATKRYFEYMLKLLPCETGDWDWPPGGILTNPGGVVAWRTPPEKIQEGIKALRRSVQDYWKARGEVRDVAPGGPVTYERQPKTIKDVRPPLSLWAKGMLLPEAVLGSILDCFDEAQLAQDLSACETPVRARISELLTSYRPAAIPWDLQGPPDREWQEERNRKYLLLLRLLALAPSPKWDEEHNSFEN